MAYIKFSIFIIILLSYFSYEVVLANDTIRHDSKSLNSKKIFKIRQATGGKLCEIQNNLTKKAVTFLDSSAKMPSGILLGNLNNFGQYEQCISLNEIVEGVNIRGKYCMMSMYLEIEENATLPAGITDGISKYGLYGICVPNACHATDINETVLPGVTIKGEELYCREINDKPLAVQDVVAIVVFSILGFLVIASSAYDLWRKMLCNEDTPKIVKSFSLCHNVTKLTRISKTANSLSCINGIRALSMIWIVVLHVYFVRRMIAIENPVDIQRWNTTYFSTWIFAGALSVDTFFYLSAFLLARSVLNKYDNSVSFLKSIPLLYLKRYLRLTPLLVAAMLLQVSFFNHVSDGPDWRVVTAAMDNCLEGWWKNLLYVHNYVQPETLCLPQTWYLAVDTQLYLFSPLVILFLLSGIKRAVFIVIVALCASMGLAFGYTYHHNCSTKVDIYGHNDRYMKYYYINTLTRSPPFILGIVAAYIMSVLKTRGVTVSNKLYKAVHWIAVAALLYLPIYAMYLSKGNELSQATVNFFNATHRASWALGVGGIIFACMHGFGGPVQWFLSLEIWIVPARLSYAIYIIHYCVLCSIVGSKTVPMRFSDSQTFYSAVADLGISFIAAFVVYLIVEAPFTGLSDLLFAKIAGSRTEDEKKKINKKEFQSPSSLDVIKGIAYTKNGGESQEKHFTTVPNLSD